MVRGGGGGAAGGWKGSAFLKKICLEVINISLLKGESKQLAI